VQIGAVLVGPYDEAGVFYMLALWGEGREGQGKVKKFFRWRIGDVGRKILASLHKFLSTFFYFLYKK